MKIIAGLGNPDKKYLKNRHNVGFIFIDVLADKIEKKSGELLQWKEDSKLKAYTVKTKFGKSDALLVKPSTYMNRSGEALSQILQYYKEPSENLIVVYDEIDLPLGKVRVRQKGSAGTHNGMRSIIAELGTENFPRIRIGIESRGVIAPKLQDLSSFVLSDFITKEEKIIQESIEEGIKELSKMV